jgi:hypothetical protein
MICPCCVMYVNRVVISQTITIWSSLFPRFLEERDKQVHRDPNSSMSSYKKETPGQSAIDFASLQKFKNNIHVHRDKI